MDYLAYELTKYSILLLPIVWLIFGLAAWFYGHRVPAIFIFISGFTGLIWNFLFMPTDHSMPEQVYWRVIVFVSYEDAPLGHYLSVYLPVISKLSLITGIGLLLKPHA